MNARRALLSAIVAASLPAIALAQTREPRMRLAVIVSPASTLTGITTGDLRRVYLGTIMRWEDGHRVVPVVLRSATREQRMLLRHVVQLTDIDYAQHWIGEVFRGRASAPPRAVASSADAVRFVAGNRSAIAVVDALAVDASVRTLSVDGIALPADDYPLVW